MKYYSDKALYVRFSCNGGGTCATKTHTIVSAVKTGENISIVSNLVVEGKTSKVTFNYKYDSNQGNYVFVNATEE